MAPHTISSGHQRGNLQCRRQRWNRCPQVSSIHNAYHVLATEIMLILDHLNIEIKLHILQDIPNIKSLCSLIHASPAMHAVYANVQRQIYTRVTLNELVERDIDILTPALFLQVKLLSRVGKILQPAIRSLYHQLTAPKGPVVLDLDQCRALRQLEDIVPWEVK